MNSCEARIIIFHSGAKLLRDIDFLCGCLFGDNAVQCVCHDPMDRSPAVGPEPGFRFYRDSLRYYVPAVSTEGNRLRPGRLAVNGFWPEAWLTGRRRLTCRKTLACLVPMIVAPDDRSGH